MRSSGCFIGPDLALGAISDPWCRHTNCETFRQSYAIYTRYQIWNVASAQEWDFTAQMLW